ncbi:MAG: hypothetical protein SGI90_16465 [Candidatus Eisenbacteria bacterium]|nr:hypothetical protein [Candidatus Eisenbacteria bacterium]
MASKKTLPKGKKAGSGAVLKEKSVKARPGTVDGGVDERAIARKNAKPRSARQSNRGS